MAPSRFMLKAAGAGAVCCGLISIAGCSAHSAGPPPHGPAEVSVQTIQTQPAELTTVLPGRTSPFETSDVRPQVSGIIVDRPFTEGADVRAGAVLYQIDPAPFRAALDQAKAQLASAQASLATLQARSDRYADLVRINAVSRQDYDDALAAARQASAGVQQQTAAVEAAAINLGYTRITAPIAGRVGRSTVTKGALVSAGQAAALTTIQRLDPIYVDLTEPAAQLVALREAMADGRVSNGGAASVGVRLQLEDGSAYPIEGRLQFTDVTVDPTTGAVTLRAIFPNPRALLLPGLFVRATVVEGVARKAILAPQQAVGRDEKGRPTAMVVDAQGRAQARLLTTGGTVGDKWLVTSGLAAGDRLIVEGQLSARPGAPVHIAQSR